MGYDKRYDGRTVDEVRPIEAKAGVIKNADGSAYFRIGGTWAYATVYGPREMFPRFQQNPKEGVLRVKYNMLPNGLPFDDFSYFRFCFVLENRRHEGYITEKIINAFLGGCIP